MNKWIDYEGKIRAWVRAGNTDQQIAELMTAELGRNITKSLVFYIRKSFGITATRKSGQCLNRNYGRSSAPQPITGEVTYIDGIRVTIYPALWAEGAKCDHRVKPRR